MPTLNRRLVLVLFVFVVLLVGGLGLAHHLQSDRIPEAFRWHAEKHAEQGQFEKAIYYTQRYLEYRPKDHEMVVNLTELIQKRGSSVRDLANVLFLFEKVLRESPQREELRRKTIDLCLRLGRYSDASIHLQTLMDQYPNEGMLWEKMGICQLAQNKFKDAKQTFEKAVARSPQQISAYERLAELLIRHLNQTEDAVRLLDQMVEKNLHDAEAYLVRARYRQSVNQLNDCMIDLDRVFQLSPEHPLATLMSAEIHQQRGQIQQARTTLQEGLALHYRDVRMYRNLAWLEASTGNVGSAISTLELGMSRVNNDSELIGPLTDLLIQRGEIDKAQSLIQKLESRKAFPAQLSYLRARILMQQERWNEALQAFGDLRREAVGMPALAAQVQLMSAICYENLGNVAGQIESLQRVLSLEPSHLTARVTLANVHLQQTRVEDAMKELGVACQSPYATLSNHVSRLRIGMQQLRKLNSDASEWKALKADIETLTQKYPQSVEPLLLTNDWFVQQNRFIEAEKFLREACSKRFQEVRLWTALAAGIERTQGRTEAMRAMNEAQAVAGDTIDFRLQQLELGLRGNSSDFPQLQAIERNLERFSETDQMRFLAEAMRLYQLANDEANSQRLARVILERQPNDVATLIDLLRSLRKMPNAKHQSAIRDLLAPLPAEYQTVLESDQRVAISSSKTTPERDYLLGFQAERRSDFTAAAKSYFKALEKDRLSSRYLKPAITALMGMNDDELVRQYVDRLLIDPRYSRSQILLAMQSLLPGLSPTQQERWHLLMNRANETDPVVRLGYLPRIPTSKDEEYLGRTLEAFPKNSDLWRALVSLKAHGKSSQPIVAVLKKAKEHLSPEAYVRLQVSSLESIRAIDPQWQPQFTNRDERLAFWDGIAAQLAQRGDRDALNAFLKQIETETPEKNWVQKTRAKWEAISPNIEDRNQSLIQVSALVNADASLPDLRSKMQVIDLHLQRAVGKERKELLNQGIDTLQRIVSREGAHLRDQFHLAQYLRQKGDRQAYRTRLMELIQKDESNLFFVLALVEELLQERDFKAIETYLEPLYRSRQDIRAVNTLARYYTATEQSRKAIDLVEGYAQAAETGTNDTLSRTQQAADLMERLARIAQSQNSTATKSYVQSALMMYRQVQKQNPEATGSVALLLAMDNQTPAAMELLQKSTKELAPRTIINAGLLVLRQGMPTPRQYQTVKDWIEAALQREPNALDLRLHLADWYGLKQEFTQAEKLYRAVLESDPQNVVALNNLAWILATKKEQSEKALEWINKAIVQLGASSELLDTRARIYLTQSRFDQASEDLDEAINQSPTALRFFHRSLSHRMQGQKSEAIKTFREAQSRGLDVKTIHPDDLASYRVLMTEIGK